MAGVIRGNRVARKFLSTTDVQSNFGIPTELEAAIPFPPEDEDQIIDITLISRQYDVVEIVTASRRSRGPAFFWRGGWQRVVEQMGLEAYQLVVFYDSNNPHTFFIEEH